MARISKKEESRRRGLATALEHQPEGVIEQIVQIRFSWVRRRVVESPHFPGKMLSTFDIWLEDPPGDPPRSPDDRCASAWSAAERLLEYRDWVRLS